MLQFYLMKNIDDDSNIFFTVVTFLLLSTSIIHMLGNTVFLEFSAAVQILISVLLLKNMIIVH